MHFSSDCVRRISHAAVNACVCLFGSTSTENHGQISEDGAHVDERHLGLGDTTGKEKRKENQVVFQEFLKNTKTQMLLVLN